MLIAMKYLGPVGIGVTSPLLFRANDDKIYVVKLQNNCMGTKVLVNEYVACWFGKKMELCFPPGDVLAIDEQVWKKNREFKRAGIEPRLHFASQYVHGNRYVSKHELHRAVNKQMMAGVMLFDHMFHNVDRTKNRKNLLVGKEDKDYVLYAIDNSHLFLRGRWNPQVLAQLVNKITVNHWRAYGWLLKYFLVAQDFSTYATKVSKIREEELKELVKSIPEEWLPRNAEREALLAYMMKRCMMVEEIVAKLCKSIPNVNRSTYFY